MEITVSDESKPTTWKEVHGGDILNSHCHALVNTVNCVGVMGKGLALAFAKQYPDMLFDYKRKCRTKQVRPGVPYVYHVSPNQMIINFPTKDHWRRPSQIRWIEQGLKILRGCLREWGVKSIAIPALGCQNGGLNWKDVKPLIEKAMKDTVDVELYHPQ